MRPPLRAIELTPGDARRLDVSTLTLSHALRGLDRTAALGEARGLLDHLAQLVGGAPDRLRRAALQSEDYVTQASLQPSPVTYPKMWEKATRTFDEAAGALCQGDPTTALGQLAHLEGLLALLGPHREPWAAAEGLGAPLVGRVEGTSVDTRRSAWLPWALEHLGAERPTPERLRQLHGAADDHAAAALRDLAEGAWGRAEQHLRRALLIDPAHGEARLVLGEVLRRLDRGEEARAEWSHLLESEPIRTRLSHGPTGRVTAHARLARTHLGLGRSLLGEARLGEARAQLIRASSHFDWTLRHAVAGTLGEEDQVHLEEAATLCADLVTRLGTELGDPDGRRPRPGR